MTYGDGMIVMSWPDHLLSLEEWEELPADICGHHELTEGVVWALPRPEPHHQAARSNLAADLNRQLPDALRAIEDSEVVIEASFPATVRAPDVMVISESLFQRNPPRIDASEVLLAVEVISPGSSKTDRILKVAEYAGAGIPYYWVIDLTSPASLTTFALVEDKYEITDKVTGPVTLPEPATVSVDVGKLTQRGYFAREI
jgi:Uma2 family endonuclease